MKPVSVKRFLVNLVLYFFIAGSLYFLYGPSNKHPNNKTCSAVQFVYQQF